MKILYVIIYGVLTFLTLSCSANKNNVVTCGGVYTPIIFGKIDVIIDSAKYNKKNELLNIFGRVFDQETSKGIYSANLILHPSGEIDEGAASNVEGEFQLKFNKSKYDSIRITAMFYKSRMLSVQDICEVYLNNNK